MISAVRYAAQVAMLHSVSAWCDATHVPSLTEKCFQLIYHSGTKRGLSVLQTMKGRFLKNKNEQAEIKQKK